MPGRAPGRSDPGSRGHEHLDVPRGDEDRLALLQPEDAEALLAHLGDDRPVALHGVELEPDDRREDAHVPDHGFDRRPPHGPLRAVPRARRRPEDEGPLDLETGGTWQVTLVVKRGGQIIASKQLSVSVAGGM